MSALLLLVLAQDPASDAASTAMAASAADGLEGRTRVELERVTTLPGDEEALHRAKAVSAGAVVEVSWPDADGRRAHLHAHLKPIAAWLDRDVVFEPSSTPTERGRAVGLAVAAMLPEDAESPPELARVPPKESEISPSFSPPIDTARAPVALGGAAASRVQAIAFGEVGEAFAGDVPTLGLRAGITYWATARLGAHLAVGGRSSSVRAASAHVLHLDAGLGAVVRLVGREAGSAFLVYVEMRAARERVTRARLDGAEERGTHALPNFAARAEVALAVGESAAVVLSLGGDVALGRTTLAINDAPTTALPRALVFGGLGARWTF